MVDWGERLDEFPTPAADNTLESVVVPLASVFGAITQHRKGTPRRNPATRGERKGTLIRHANLCAAFSIVPLAIAMIVSSCGALLVPTVGAASLFPTGLLPTHRATVVLAPVTAAADPEDVATAASTTNSLTENNFGSARHSRAKARLDNGNPFMAGYEPSVRMANLMKVCHWGSRPLMRLGSQLSRRQRQTYTR
jgi:hypothetical protein